MKPGFAPAWVRFPPYLNAKFIRGRWRGMGRGEGGEASWEGGSFDTGCVNAFLAAALSRVVRTAVPIPAVATASVLHSAVVGGFVAGDVELL